MVQGLHLPTSPYTVRWSRPIMIVADEHNYCRRLSPPKIVVVFITESDFGLNGTNANA